MEFTISLVLVVMLAGLIKGFTGFGLSLVLVSALLGLGFAPTEMLPILVPLFVILDILLYVENRNRVHMDFRENFTIHYTTLMSLFFGILLGAYLLVTTDASIIKLIFAFVILLCVFFLIEKTNNHQMIVPPETHNGIFGFVTGVLTGLFTLNAVPPSIYLLYHQYPKAKYMGALVTFLIFSDAILVGVYLFLGLFTLQGFLTSLTLSAIVIAGFGVGIFLRRNFPSKHFKGVVIFVLTFNALKIIFDYFVF